MKRILFSLFLIIPIVSLAQSNYRKGYVVTSSKDTLKGYINYKERAITPSSISFKARLDDKAQTFTTESCLAYGIDDQAFYQRFAVNLTMSKVAVDELSNGRDSSARRDTVFLKVLQTGKNVTLFAYRDALKLRYYLQENDSVEPYELVRQVFLKNDNATVTFTDNQYARQLHEVLKKFGKDTPSAEKKLEFLRYEESSLIKIAATINEKQVMKSKISYSRFFVGTGLTYTKVNYTGSELQDLTNAAAKSKGSYMPLFTFGIDFLANPAIGKLIYRAELSLLLSNHKVSTTTSSVGRAALAHTFNQQAVAFTPQIIYNIYNTKNTKAFVGGGFGLNFAKYSNNVNERYNSLHNETVYEENRTQLQSLYFSFPVNAGVVVRKNIELSIGYSLPVAITDYALYSINMQRYKFGISYLFGKK